MAAGRPVIALKLGGPATLVSRDAGLIIPPGSTDVTVQRLADAMVSLATDHDRVLQLGAAGKQHIAANYLWPHIVGIYHNLHTEISEQ